MSDQESMKQMGKMLSKVWMDDALKQRFLANPAEVMRENGIAVPEGVTVKVHEDHDNVRNITLPQRPAKLSDDQLDLVAGGSGNVWPLTVSAAIPY